ncbi:CYTH domain-containing protein [Psychrobacillus lasiicapitis]|uniref:CYTH domain-containing protein n=1 Tax=Psychrobacillus lasiicapitis TaxID=1636719 RepID=A0A544TEE6_9BACI|nr:CYTH domain-containing protein [Psychrobacillus lasiicapitis]
MQTVYNRNNKKGSEIVHSEREIEFKNLLTKEEFQGLVSFLGLTSTNFQTQTNYYFDTPASYFKENKMGFRLRVLPNRNELTLKIPVQEHVMEEKTVALSNDERDAIIYESRFPAVSFLEQIKDKGPLTCIGSMQTDRAQIVYKNGTLFLDHSFYSRIEDFEVEYECGDVKNGQKVFLQLLEENHIPLRTTDKKIARLMKYNNSLKG